MKLIAWLGKLDWEVIAQRFVQIASPLAVGGTLAGYIPYKDAVIIGGAVTLVTTMMKSALAPSGIVRPTGTK